MLLLLFFFHNLSVTVCVGSVADPHTNISQSSDPYPLLTTLPFAAHIFETILQDETTQQQMAQFREDRLSHCYFCLSIFDNTLKRRAKTFSWEGLVTQCLDGKSAGDLIQEMRLLYDMQAEQESCAQQKDIMQHIQTYFERLFCDMGAHPDAFYLMNSDSLSNFKDITADEWKKGPFWILEGSESKPLWPSSHKVLAQFFAGEMRVISQSDTTLYTEERQKRAVFALKKVLQPFLSGLFILQHQNTLAKILFATPKKGKQAKKTRRTKSV